LEPTAVFASAREEDVDALRESRKPVEGNRVATDDHVFNAIGLE
jgi:hypothetical protein